MNTENQKRGIPPHGQAANKTQAVVSVSVEIAPGELIDKITILEIKSERIHDPGKLKNINVQLETLASSRDKVIEPSEALTRLTSQLKQINEALWDIEDEIRVCERNQNFGSQFVELARSIYVTNDQRSDVKREINLLLGSQLVEEKFYEDYQNPDAKDSVPVAKERN